VLRRLGLPPRGAVTKPRSCLSWGCALPRPRLRCPCLVPLPLPLRRQDVSLLLSRGAPDAHREAIVLREGAMALKLEAGRLARTEMLARQKVAYVERVNAELSELIEKCDADALAAQVGRLAGHRRGKSDSFPSPVEGLPHAPMALAHGSPRSGPLLCCRPPPGGAGGRQGSAVAPHGHAAGRGADAVGCTANARAPQTCHEPAGFNTHPHSTASPALLHRQSRCRSATGACLRSSRRPGRPPPSSGRRRRSAGAGAAAAGMAWRQAPAR
jgi:hypothetical protein